jgi:PAS domain S-box-containing protein
VSNAILIIDRNSRIILHNEAFCRVFETEGKEFIGMDINEFYKVINYNGISLWDILSEKKYLEQPQEINVTTVKGNRLELLSYKAPITNVEGDIIGAICISTDVTYIKKQQHIIQQQEKLALIGQMAAGIVHEIKNPLATIKGLSQLIFVKAKVDKVKEYTAVVDTAINDITEVVNEFLDFAKPKPAVAARTTLNRIVESMQLISETRCYTKNIRCSFHYYPWPMEVTADETKIKQVILNIIENAIYAMENVETPTLVVSTYFDTDSKEGVIKIEDNGMGMSKEVFSKLGTPFFTTKEKGTGLGLGISYEIMREHKGRIEVDSEEGKGTTFKVIFTQIEDLI